MSATSPSNDPVILLVDDQPDFLDSLKLTLDMAGYQTLIANDAQHALELLRSRPVSLILSDIMMPEMGGYQFYHHVRENPRWAFIPFLFLTGSPTLSAHEIRYGQAMGVDGYLTKPIRAQELLKAVEQQVAGSL